MSFESNAQGVISRPTKSTKNIKKASKKIRDEDSLPKISEPDGYINGHGYVDLGLPSGLKWATCNVGANLPEQAGLYYAWGETKSKNNYSEKNSITVYKNIDELKSMGIIDSLDNLTPSYDAATINWKASWKMPTREESKELVDNCTWVRINNRKFNGFHVTGPNGKSIFIPCSGRKEEGSLLYNMEFLFLWCGTIDNSHTCYSYTLYYIGYKPTVGQSFRVGGFNIRAVSK